MINTLCFGRKVNIYSRTSYSNTYFLYLVNDYYEHFCLYAAFSTSHAEKAVIQAESLDTKYDLDDILSLSFVISFS